MSFPKLSWGRKKNDLSERWPKMPDGSGEPPAFLTFSTDEGNAADMTVEMLRAYGIPALKDYGENGTLGKVILGTPTGGVALYVPEHMLEDARNLITPIDETIPNEEEQ